MESYVTHNSKTNEEFKSQDHCGLFEGVKSLIFFAQHLKALNYKYGKFQYVLAVG